MNGRQSKGKDVDRADHMYNHITKQFILMSVVSETVLQRLSISN